MRLLLNVKRVIRGVLRSIARRKFVLSPLANDDRQQHSSHVQGFRAANHLHSMVDLQSSRRRFPAGWVRFFVPMRILDGDDALGWMIADEESASRRLAIPRPVNGMIEHIARLPATVRRLRYEPVKTGIFVLGEITVQEIGGPEAWARQIFRYCQRENLTLIGALLGAIVQIRIYGFWGLWSWLSEYVNGEHPDKSYGPWVKKHDSWPLDKRHALQADVVALRHRPKFSIIMPVYNTPRRWLRKAIDSVIAQAYENWELCICDDNSNEPHVAPLLASYQHDDARIKVVSRTLNGRIATATNEAMSLMTGEFMCLMDHDDVLPPHALFEFAKALEEEPDADFIYSDEDLITIDDVRSEPIIKPAWSPEYLESCMYIGHLVCYRTDIVRRIGGFRLECEGAQDYDFALRYSEQARKIRHIPKILYHWRVLPGSVAASIERKGYAITSAKRALEDHLNRNGETGTIIDIGKGFFETKRDVLGAPFVSIIVSCAGFIEVDAARAVEMLANCLEAIRSRSTYGAVEILLVDDGTPSLNIAFRAERHCRTLKVAAEQAKGAFLVFLSGDTKIASPDWLENMLRHAQRSGVGAVGAKLLFGDGTLKHVGMTFSDGLPRYIRQGYPGLDWGYRGSSALPRNVMAVSGACLMVSREAFDAVDGLSLEFAPAYHDVDLCLKLLESGRRNIFCPSAILHQLGTDTRTAHLETQVLFREKWRSATRLDPYYGVNLTLRPPTFEFDGGLDDRSDAKGL